MIITDFGKLIRMPVKGIPTLGRNTQGVRLIRVEDAEKVVAIESLPETARDDDEEVTAGPVEVIEGEEDLTDDTVEFETPVPEDEGSDDE
jgi:DNA gyrase subunit A